MNDSASCAKADRDWKPSCNIFCATVINTPHCCKKDQNMKTTTRMTRARPDQSHNLTKATGVKSTQQFARLEQ